VILGAAVDGRCTSTSLLCWALGRLNRVQDGSLAPRPFYIDREGASGLIARPGVVVISRPAPALRDH